MPRWINDEFSFQIRIETNAGDSNWRTTEPFPLMVSREQQNTCQCRRALWECNDLRQLPWNFCTKRHCGLTIVWKLSTLVVITLHVCWSPRFSSVCRGRDRCCSAKAFWKETFCCTTIPSKLYFFYWGECFHKQPTPWRTDQSDCDIWADAQQSTRDRMKNVKITQLWWSPRAQTQLNRTATYCQNSQKEYTKEALAASHDAVENTNNPVFTQK